MGEAAAFLGTAEAASPWPPTSLATPQALLLQRALPRRWLLLLQSLLLLLRRNDRSA
jgi:hypothetical protein